MSLIPRLVEVFALLSLLSIGGANATLPEIHRQVVVLHHWMSDATFAQVVAIGQTAPGPNVMIASMIGWQLAGVAGLLAVTLAIVLPSSGIAIVVGRLVARYEVEGGSVALARRALAPIALGFMLASSVVMTRAAWLGAGTLVLVAAVAVVVVLTRWSPLWSIGAGALVGLVGHRLHWI